MKSEIETRFLEIDKKKIISTLKNLGATDMGEVKLNEMIFYDTDLKWLDENRFIRVRKNNDRVTITYKHNKHQKVDSAMEIEFEVSDFDKANKFVEEIGGFIPYRIVEKYRHTFELDGVILDIDTWPKIPTYVELEGGSVDALKNVAKKLGLEWSDRFDKDARYVYKKYGFDFDRLTVVTFDKFE